MTHLAVRRDPRCHCRPRSARGSAVGRRSWWGCGRADFRLRAVEFALEEAPPQWVDRLSITAEVVEQLGSEQLVVFPVARAAVPRRASAGCHPPPCRAPGAGHDDETLLAEPQTSRFTLRLDMRRADHAGEPVDVYSTQSACTCSTPPPARRSRARPERAEPVAAPMPGFSLCGRR